MKYNVYIIKNDGSEAHLIGSNMREERASQRVMSGLMRCDRSNYFVADYEVGSEEDLKLSKLIN